MHARLNLFNPVKHYVRYRNVLTNPYSFIASKSTVRQYSSISATANGIHIEDEYKDNCAHTEACTSTYTFQNPYKLDSGAQLDHVDIGYTTYGKLNTAKDNVIVLCHALTGDSLVHQWWDSIVETSWTEKYFLICTNILGSCKGTTGPSSINPKTGERYGDTFPDITIRDAVRLQRLLLSEKFGVTQVRSVIGGSLGGMQTLEWAFFGPEVVKSFIPIACGSHHSAWQIGISELQRQAILMDRQLSGSSGPASTAGLSLARQIAMISYRTHAAYQEKYGRNVMETTSPEDAKQFMVESYLAYQGEKFLSRFDADTYMTLTKLMDTHDVGYKRNGIPSALATLSQPALVVGIESDVLYPLSEQIELRELLPNAQFEILTSKHGHDAFLLEQEKISSLAKKFLQEHGL